MNASSDRPLSDAVCLVTGAAGGLGQATCLAMAEAGGTVIGTDIVDQPADVKVDLWLRHDVSSQDDWARVRDEISTRYGRLDCLVNNAAILLIESIEDTSLEAWRRVQSINVESVLISLQTLLPLLRTSGEQRTGGAAVINVSSPAGVLGSGFACAYSASKAAMTNLTKTAVKEFGIRKYPIRLNNVYPGGANNMGMAETVKKRYIELGLADSEEDFFSAGIEKTPLGRLCEPSEIAAGIVFLCSPAASYLSGVDLPVHGGLMF